jgi:hypothetical protein
LDAFLVEFYSVEEVENPDYEDDEFGSGWDDIIIDINPQSNIVEQHLQVFMQRRVKLYKDQDEYQVSASLAFDKAIPSGSFKKKSDFFTEKEDWLEALNNNPIFQMTKDSEPIDFDIKLHVDCVG